MDWEFELVAGPYGSPVDGPVWDGAALLFAQSVFPANSAKNRILRFDPSSGQVTDFRRWTNRTVSLAFSAKGDLYGCQSAGRRLVQFHKDGSTSALAHKIDGVYHNQPKDLTVDSQSRIWFCDPHGDLRSAINPQIHDKLDHASVLRLEVPDHPDSPITRMTYDTDAPVAVLLSKDERTLYVSENSEELDGPRELRAYSVSEEGSLGPYILLHTFGSDFRGKHEGITGMCLEIGGNIVACAGSKETGPGPMIYVFSPEGRVLETQALPEKGTNCVFGDQGLQTLYVTTESGCLYRCRNSGREGWALYPTGA